MSNIIDAIIADVTPLFTTIEGNSYLFVIAVIAVYAFGSWRSGIRWKKNNPDKHDDPRYK